MRVLFRTIAFWIGRASTSMVRQACPELRFHRESRQSGTCRRADHEREVRTALPEPVEVAQDGGLLPHPDLVCNSATPLPKWAYYKTVSVNGILAPCGIGLRRGVSPSSRPSPIEGEGGIMRPHHKVSCNKPKMGEGPVVSGLLPILLILQQTWDGGLLPHPDLVCNSATPLPKWARGRRRVVYFPLRSSCNRPVPSIISGQALSLPKWLRTNGTEVDCILA